ncbi:MAG: hypothetical protein ABIL68_13390 [bacterium]
MRHPSLDIWEEKLKKVLDELDDFLEDKFGEEYDLHPVRTHRGKTANKAQDGLFDIVASFSMGAGSQYGKGYVVDVHIATLDQVPEKIQREIEGITLRKLRATLPKYFPGKNLNVDKDGNIIKIHGDLSLGTL